MVVISGGLLVLFTLFFREGIVESLRLATVRLAGGRLRALRRPPAATTSVSDSSPVA